MSDLREAARDPEADDAPCGCGAMYVPAHTNAQHYANLESPVCNDDFFCGSCPDCLTGEHPENRPRRTALESPRKER